MATQNQVQQVIDELNRIAAQMNNNGGITPTDDTMGNPLYEPGFGAVSANPDGTVGASQLNPNAGTAASATKPLTGFAARYTPSQATQAFENPWYILRDVFPGISVSSPGYQGLRDFGADPLSIYNIATGADRVIEDQGGGEFINFMADLYRQLGTPGGQGFSAQNLLSNIVQAANDTSEEGLARTTLGQILNAGDQSTQIRTLFNLLREVSNVTQNPLGAAGYQAAVAQAGDLYGNRMMQTEAGNTVNPAVWFQQNAPWLLGR